MGVNNVKTRQSEGQSFSKHHSVCYVCSTCIFTAQEEIFFIFKFYVAAAVACFVWRPQNAEEMYGWQGGCTQANQNRDEIQCLWLGEEDGKTSWGEKGKIWLLSNIFTCSLRGSARLMQGSPWYLYVSVQLLNSFWHAERFLSRSDWMIYLCWVQCLLTCSHSPS